MEHLFTRTGRARYNSVVVYEGPSRIDGKPIVVFVTGLRASNNSKTGNMVQSHIVRSDMSPMEALKTGGDASICGACPLRPQGYDGVKYWERGCYVNAGQAPLALYRAYVAGNIPKVTPSELSALTTGRMTRLGSYGDPAAVPMWVWEAFTRYAKGHTGYTHQWRSPKLRDVLKWCQVSADSPEDARAARRAGVGSFRVTRPNEEVMPFETVCPASEEAGRVATCQDCGMCSGLDGASVVIAPHGIGKGSVRKNNRRSVDLPVLNEARAEAHN